MTTPRPHLATLLLLPLLLNACDHLPRPIPSDVAVRIDGEAIPYPRFETYLRDNVDGKELPTESPLLSRLFDQFLDEELLIRLAIERGLAVPAPPVVNGDAGGDAANGDAGNGSAANNAAVTPDVEPRTAITFLLRKGGLKPPKQDEIEAYYLAHADLYQRPESVRLRQILADEEEAAKKALAALRRGEDFVAVAARFSQVPAAELGGTDGRLAREDLPPAFADQIFALKSGEISEIFKADYGLHIFQVIEHFPAEKIPLEDVSAEISAALQRRNVDELVASFIEEARGRYAVEIYLSNVPFDYRGKYVRDNADDE